MRGSIVTLKSAFLPLSLALVGFAAGGATAAGCSSSSGSSFGGDGGGGGTGGDGGGGGTRLGGGGHDSGTAPLGGGSTGGPGDAGYGADAFFATDPPRMYCGVDGGAPDAPVGTPHCPSDKNREGCPCTTQGATAACWPGLRVDRDLGQCKDGTTTCVANGEGLSQAWGPCTGYVLPSPGATSGAAACKCFSSGEWNIANLSPCFIEYPSGAFYGVSSLSADGGITCPSLSATPPPTAPATWSTDTLKVDCEGQFTLCYTIKAGSATSPQPSDCVVGTACVSGDYTTANAVQSFPSLPGWASTDPACSEKFQASGGYGEMTVKGLSEFCEPIGANDGGAPMVFNTVPYCGADAGPNCQSGGSGTFGQ